MKISAIQADYTLKPLENPLKTTYHLIILIFYVVLNIYTEKMGPNTLSNIDS